MSLYRYCILSAIVPGIVLGLTGCGQSPCSGRLICGELAGGVAEDAVFLLPAKLEEQTETQARETQEEQTKANSLFLDKGDLYAIAYALEFVRTGEAYRWKSREDGPGFSLTPTSGISISSAGYCNTRNGLQRKFRFTCKQSDVDFCQGFDIGCRVDGVWCLKKGLK